MANKRMFSDEVIETDTFRNLPPQAQILYFHMCMAADDDGFVVNTLSLLRSLRVRGLYLECLLDKRYVLKFASGVCVIKHWYLNNYIRPDRYKSTNYIDEMALLIKKPNGVYTEKLSQIGIPESNQVVAKRLPIGNQAVTQIRLDKISIKNKDIVLFEESVKEIISYLNTKSGTNYKSSSTRTKKFIHARLEDGFIVDNFKKVIDIKCSQWLNDEKMSIYLRPETLFGAKFESYLNEKEVKGSKSKFNQIEKSNYDMELLEKELLEN